MTDDRAWIRGIRDGEPETLCAVYTAYKDELFSLALVLARDRALAEDVLQDVFVDLARKGRSLTIRSNLKGYLVACVANRVRARYRGQRVPRPIEEAAAPEECASPEGALQRQETKRHVDAALAALPADQREIIVLHLHSGLTFQAIATQQGVSINTVQSRYRYGLAKLRTLLNSEMER